MTELQKLELQRLVDKWTVTFTLSSRKVTTNVTAEPLFFIATPIKKDMRYMVYVQDLLIRQAFKDAGVVFDKYVEFTVPEPYGKTLLTNHELLAIFAETKWRELYQYIITYYEGKILEEFIVDMDGGPMQPYAEILTETECFI